MCLINIKPHLSLKAKKKKKKGKSNLDARTTRKKQ